MTFRHKKESKQAITFQLHQDKFLINKSVELLNKLKLVTSLLHLRHLLDRALIKVNRACIFTLDATSSTFRALQLITSEDGSQAAKVTRPTTTLSYVLITLPSLAFVNIMLLSKSTRQAEFLCKRFLIVALWKSMAMSSTQENADCLTSIPRLFALDS
jgi:hypothetical protein